MVMMTTAPGDIEVPVQGRRWEPARCTTNKRVVDVNPVDGQVRWWCDRCRVHHVYDLGLTGVRPAGFVAG